MSGGKLNGSGGFSMFYLNLFTNPESHDDLAKQTESAMDFYSNVINSLCCHFDPTLA